MGEASVKRSLNDVLKVELNFVGFRRIGKSIEGLLRCSLNTFDNSDDSIYLRLIDQALRPIDEQTNVFAKLDVSGQLHYGSRVVEIALPLTIQKRSDLAMGL